ncbi:glutathione S-transferase, partial [Pseudomonas syringae]
MSPPTMTVDFHAASALAGKVMVMAHESAPVQRVELQATLLPLVSPTAPLNGEHSARR